MDFLRKLFGKGQSATSSSDESFQLPRDYYPQVAHCYQCDRDYGKDQIGLWCDNCGNHFCAECWGQFKSTGYDPNMYGSMKLRKAFMEKQPLKCPNCGTNFAVAGILAGGVSALTMFGTGRRLRDKLERVPLAITLATLALMFAQPLGLFLQARITTTGYPDSLEIVEVVPKGSGQPRVHRVVTQG